MYKALQKQLCWFYFVAYVIISNMGVRWPGLFARAVTSGVLNVSQ